MSKTKEVVEAVHFDMKTTEVMLSNCENKNP